MRRHRSDKHKNFNTVQIYLQKGLVNNKNAAYKKDFYVLINIITI